MNLLALPNSFLLLYLLLDLATYLNKRKKKIQGLESTGDEPHPLPAGGSDGDMPIGPNEGELKRELEEGDQPPESGLESSSWSSTTPSCRHSPNSAQRRNPFPRTSKARTQQGFSVLSPRRSPITSPPAPTSCSPSRNLTRYAVPRTTRSWSPAT